MTPVAQISETTTSWAARCPSDARRVRRLRVSPTALIKREACWLLPRHPSRLAARLDPSREEWTPVELLC
jgi:hypothetical protein